MLPMTVLRTATTGRIGLWAECLLERARGSMVVTAFTDMSTTGLIRITAMLGRCRSAGRSASTTFREMRREMDEETWATPAMNRGVSTRSLDIGVVAGMLVDMAAGITRARMGVMRFGRNSRL